MSLNRDLTVGKPGKVLLRFCLPLFASIIFQQLYNIADSFVAGKFIGNDALAAVGNSYEITLIFIAFAFGCNIGCSVIAAQLFGAKKFSDLKTLVYTVLISSGVLCVVLMTCGFLFGGALLKLIRTPTELLADSKLYLDIYIAGLPFMFYYNVATGIFSAMGDSKTPFIFLACSSTANIGMDILFVHSFSMGVAGVAWATFICQGVSCILAVAFVLKRLHALECENRGDRVPVFSWHLFGRFAEIAVPSILQQSFISVGNIIIQSVINNFGAAVMAGYSSAVKLNNMVTTSLTTLGNGISSFTAQNLGAAKPERIKGRTAACVCNLRSACAFVFLCGQAACLCFFGKPDRHGSGYRNALFAHNFAVLSYCCRKACCGRRFARCGHDEKVYGDDLQRFDSARCACGGIVENRTRNNGNLACMAHRLDDRNRAVAHFLRHGRLEKIR